MSEKGSTSMFPRSSPHVAVVLAGLLPAVAAAFTVRAIYQEGNLLSSAAALLIPIALLLTIHADAPARIASALMGVLAGSVATLVWVGLGHDLHSFALLTVVLTVLIVPITVDLVLLDVGTRVPLTRRAAAYAMLTFVICFLPLGTALVRSEHGDVVRHDQALIREVAQHVQVQRNAIVFERVDPKHKAELKNRLAVRAQGRTYQLSNAHFESVSEERTVRKKTERQGARKTEVSRQREEQMRVVVDLDDPTPPANIILFSTRGPVTIAEQEVALPGEDALQDPVS